MPEYLIQVVELFLSFVFMVIFHELGHYLTALHYGWNPRLIFINEGIRSSICVLSEPQATEGVDELLPLLKKALIFRASGCIGVFPIIMITYLLDLKGAWVLVLLILLYSLTETITTFDDFPDDWLSELEDQGEIN